MNEKKSLSLSLELQQKIEAALTRFEELRGFL